MRIVTHKEMTAIQNQDYCVKIFDKNGDLAMSCTFPREINENELKSTIDNYYFITGNAPKKQARVFKKEQC